MITCYAGQNSYHVLYCKPPKTFPCANPCT